MKSLSNFKYSFSNVFTRQFLLNKHRNAFRFENQNLTWTYQEFENHSNAFAYGLVENGWKQGDRLLLLLGQSNTSESAASFVGAAKAGVVVVPLRTNFYQQLEETLNLVAPKGILFSPNMVFEDGKLIDAIQRLVPEADKTLSGNILTSAQHQNLKWLIHTGFYSYPGTYKFKQTLVYASKNFNRLQLPEVSEQQIAVELVSDGTKKTLSIKDLENLYQNNLSGAPKNVIVTGDPQTIVSFSTILRGLQEDQYTVLTGSDSNEKVQRILGFYPNPQLLSATN